MWSIILLLLFAAATAFGFFFAYDAYKLEDDGWLIFAAFGAFFAILFLAIVINALSKYQQKTSQDDPSSSTSFIPHWYILTTAIVSLLAIVLIVVFV